MMTMILLLLTRKDYVFNSEKFIVKQIVYKTVLKAKILDLESERVSDTLYIYHMA